MPTEAEIQTQWRNAIAIPEAVRAVADDSILGAGGLIDALVQSLEGEITPYGMPAFASEMRDALFAALHPSTIAIAIDTALAEYMLLLGRSPGGSRSQVWRALYEHFVANNKSVKSRNFTRGTPTAGGSNVGNAAMFRLVVDENGFPLEACRAETKTFRCKADQNSGTQRDAEVFYCEGDPISPIAIESGGGLYTDEMAVLNDSVFAGGSLIENGGFTGYSETGEPKFDGWEEIEGGSQITQATVGYRATAENDLDTVYSCKITGTGGNTVTIRRSLTARRAVQLDTETPYFLRVMWNRSLGSGAGGTVKLTIGSQTVSAALSAQSGWQELVLGPGAANWYRTFATDDLGIELEWDGGTSGYVLFSSVILAPLTRIDGTYRALRHTNASPVAHMIGDLFTEQDTGGAPADAVIQFWNSQIGYYLPSVNDASETFADPA